MKERRINEFKGVVLIALGLILLASLVSFNYFDLPFYTSHPNLPPKNFIRGFGAYLGWLVIFLFGKAASYIIPAVVLALGIKFFRQQNPELRLPRILGFIVLLLSVSSFIGIIYFNNQTLGFSRAGLLGFLISRFVTTYFGKLGSYIIFITLIVLSAALVAETLVSTLMLGLINKTKPLFKMMPKFKIPVSIPKIKQDTAIQKKKFFSLKFRLKPDLEERPVASGQKESPAAVKPYIRIKAEPAAATLEVKAKPKEVKTGDYHLPTLDLLSSPPPPEARQIKEDLAHNARILEETLDDFGISVKVTDVERGPVITRYELEPAPGVKVNRITALADDIALTMKAQSIRIVAPIPGKSRVGVEVPNMQSSFVYLKEVIVSKEFQESRSRLTLALGKDIAGQPVITDLADMPHLLIAGTTGSGKTVCVNSLILSLLFKNTPLDLKLLMVDPKMVELLPFNGLSHLICPVVTDAKKAAAALNWVVSEMEERYRLFAKAGARNIEIYNEKQERIPYIVVIVDELADLMMVARDQIENAITRLAQLSRATGIHLILATQRPSVDVITGVIKANFPARVSFKVSSKVDSRTVLDMNGADKLLGKGDMLFLKPGESKLIRAQSPLVTDKEISQIVDFVKAQSEPVFDEEILKEQQKSLVGGNQEKDELYDEAVRIIIESNQASVSILQRRLRLGYTRAARIIDTMEIDGLVGPFEGSKPRKILVDRDKWLKDSLVQQEERR